MKKPEEILYNVAGLVYTEHPKVIDAMKEFAKEYHKKQLSINGVMQAKPEKVCECKCEYPIIRQDLKEYCSVCGLNIS
ncbi:hypothetical protein [Seonamhaeicola sp.]|uniref:hypothetical protein n=1 Tax=Seonamhaeicola sp. TaxID=1912245 RepID=UPI003566D62D